MWIVRVALQRPYTFIMLAVLIVLMGGYAILNTATDIFPNIRIPIAAVIWRYNGILPEEIANRIVLFSERVAQTTVNDVEHTESQSVTGTSVVDMNNRSTATTMVGPAAASRASASAETRMRPSESAATTVGSPNPR